MNIYIYVYTYRFLCVSNLQFMAKPVEPALASAAQRCPKRGLSQQQRISTPWRCAMGSKRSNLRATTSATCTAGIWGYNWIMGTQWDYMGLYGVVLGIVGINY